MPTCILFFWNSVLCYLYISTVNLASRTLSEWDRESPLSISHYFYTLSVLCTWLCDNLRNRNWVNRDVLWLSVGGILRGNRYDFSGHMSIIISVYISGGNPDYSLFFKRIFTCTKNFEPCLTDISHQKSHRMVSRTPWLVWFLVCTFYCVHLKTSMVTTCFMYHLKRYLKNWQYLNKNTQNYFIFSNIISIFFFNFCAFTEPDWITACLCNRLIK